MFAAGALSLCAGIVAGSVLFFLPASVLLVGIFALIVLFVSVGSFVVRSIVVYLILFLLGMFVYFQDLPPKGVPLVSQIQEGVVRVEGTVAGDLEERVSGGRVTIKNVRVAQQPAYGRVSVFLPPAMSWRAGDHVAFSCDLKKPESFEGFAYDQYLASRDIYALCFRPQALIVQKPGGWGIVRAAMAARRYVVGRVQAFLPEPQAAFISGLIFGGNSALAQDWKEDFARTGMSHILAASGFNVSLFAYTFLAWITATPLGRRRGILATGALVLTYTIAAGATPAVVRAAIMAGLILLAAWVGRKPFVPNLLLGALAVMLLLSPRLLHDVGFQLSFVATAAVLFLAPVLQKKFAFLPETIAIRESVAGSVSAILLTTPILLWHFGTFSLVAPVANLLVLPAVPYVMTLALLALVVGSVHASLGVLAMQPVWAFATLMLSVIRALGSLPWAQLHIVFAKAVSMLTFVLLLVAGWRARRRLAQV